EPSAETGELVGLGSRFLPPLELRQEQPALISAKPEKLVVAEGARSGDRFGKLLASADGRIHVFRDLRASVGTKLLAQRAQIVKLGALGRVGDFPRQNGNDRRRQRALAFEGGSEKLPIRERKRYVVGRHLHGNGQHGSKERDDHREKTRLPAFEMSEKPPFSSHDRCNT